MKKSYYKHNLSQLKLENRRLQEALVNQILVNSTPAKDEVVTTNDMYVSDPDFLDQKACESVVLQRAKLLSMDETESTQEECSRERKRIIKQLKDNEKQIKKITPAIAVMDKKYSKLLERCLQFEKENKKLKKRNQALENDVELIKQFFVASAFYGGYCDVGDSFEKIMKRGIKAQKSKTMYPLLSKKKGD